MKAQRPTASNVMAALTRRYAPPAWALLEQVSNGTGYSGRRYADAMALSLWPSRGIHLHGFEVKTYRNDWLRELKNPAKADEIVPYCDFWWVVTGSGDVVKDGELPPEWGLMVLDGRGLVQHQAASKRTALALDVPMLAAILRRATEAMVPRSGVQAAIDEAREKGEEIGRLLAPETDTNLRSRVHELEVKIADFENAAGIKLPTYGVGNHGRAFKIALEMGENGAVGRARYMVDNLRRAADQIEALTAPDKT
jgi:hypothetical protein